MGAIMAQKTGFTLNTKDFDIKFPRVINKEIPEAAAFTMYGVAATVIGDAILEEPKAPHKTGHLKRTQQIEAPQILAGEISIKLGFDAEYAAAVHEMPAPYKDPSMEGSGPKFLESKLIKNKEKYMAKIAAGIRKKGGP